MLEVVQQSFDRLLSGALLHAEHHRDRLRHEARICDSGEVREPNAVQKFVRCVGGGLQREAGLSEAADAHQRQQAGPDQRLTDVGKLALATDERTGLLRKVVRRCGERAQWREILAQLRMHELEDALRAGEIAKPHSAKIMQRHVFGQAIGDHSDGRFGQQHLSPVRRRHQACGAIDCRAEDLVVAVFRYAEMQTATHQQR